jgi:hypothetical protein
MKFIFVDTPTRNISLIDAGDKPSLPVIYSLIGCNLIEYHLLPHVPNHAFYCDEEGRLKTPTLPTFLFYGFPSRIYGRILIFRMKGDDLIYSPSVSVSDISERISWMA